MKKDIEIKHSKCMCWISDSVLLIYKRGYFCFFDVKSGIITTKIKFQYTFFERIGSIFRLTRRLLRLYPMSAVFCEKSKEVLFTFNGFFYSLNIENKTICKETRLLHGAKRVLSICVCSDFRVIYGEYRTSYDNEPVCIIERKIDKSHAVIYKIDASSIRHIHMICEYKNDIYCFTGDEDEETKILKFINKDFNKTPITILGGNQMYRACFACFFNDCIYYATDTPYMKNALFSYDLKSGVLNKIIDLEGTVIYGTKMDNQLFFSTCVEYNLKKDIDNKNAFIKIDGENGGILSKNSYLYTFDLKTKKYNLLCNLKKDSYSIRLFGIGTFCFSSNNQWKSVAYTSLGLIDDEKTTIYRLDNIK